MSNLYFGITRYGYDICNEISDMACFSLNLKTAVDFNAEARCARDEMHLRRSRQVTRGQRPSPVGGASGCVVGLPERSEPEGPQWAARRRSLSFFFRRAFRHLDNLPFRFDSFNCTTFPLRCAHLSVVCFYRSLI